MLRRAWFNVAAFAIIVLAGCNPRPADYRPAISPEPAQARSEFTFAVHPLHNPQLLFESYGPLIDHLNRKLPAVHLRLVASDSYDAFERRLAAREFDFALPNPYQTLTAARAGYRVFGKMADDDRFRGIILVRKDAGVAGLEYLRGKTISYPAPTALAAAMLPQQFLRDHGLKAGETQARYVGSQESSIESVYRGASTAGATWPPPWEAYARAHPEIAEALDVRWRTPPLINNALIVRDDVPASVRDAVAQALFELGATAEGRTILQRIDTSAFTPASEATYAPVAAFLKTFEAGGGADPDSRTSG